jgi:hypothetical protein
MVYVVDGDGLHYGADLFSGWIQIDGTLWTGYCPMGMGCDHAPMPGWSGIYFAIDVK